MSYAEFVEWQAFAAHEPFGDARSDLQTALILTLLAQIFRGKKGRKPKLEDFLPDWWSTRARVMSAPARLAAKFRTLTGNDNAEGNTDTDVSEKLPHHRQKGGI